MWTAMAGEQTILDWTMIFAVPCLVRIRWLENARLALVRGGIDDELTVKMGVSL
jgi:hypothetical protein